MESCMQPFPRSGSYEESVFMIEKPRKKLILDLKVSRLGLKWFELVSSNNNLRLTLFKKKGIAEGNKKKSDEE